MKYLFKLLAASATITAGTSSAAVIETHPFLGLGIAVPDGNPSGLANNQLVDGSIVSIDSVKVSLNVTTTFNGDLYAYVTHGSGFSILLNRSGRTAGNDFGYDDDGFDVTFSDLASFDIHTYQDIIISSPVTGEWKPDGRLIDPDLVIDTDPRTSHLSSFNGLDPNGTWTLFIADLSGGAPTTLNSWSLEITGSAIPEPTRALLLAIGLGSLALRRRRC